MKKGKKVWIWMMVLGVFMLLSSGIVNAAWNIQIIDPVGSLSSKTLMLDSSGNPSIGYRDSTWMGLKYAKYVGPSAGGNCGPSSTWKCENVASGTVLYSSFALDSSNNPSVTYCVDDESGLCHHVYYKSRGATFWNTEQVIDGTGSNAFVFSDISMAPHYSGRATYYGIHGFGGYNGLNYASGSGVEGVNGACAYNNCYNSLAIDSSGYPHVTYSDGGYLFYSTKTGTWSWETVDNMISEGTSGTSLYKSMVLDSGGIPNILYYDAGAHNNLKYAKRVGTLGTCIGSGGKWNCGVVASNLGVGGYVGQNSLALDSNGNPHISYCAGSNGINLMYTYWTGLTWSTPQVVDSTVCGENSIAIDSSGIVHIAYGGLKYATLVCTDSDGDTYSPDGGSCGTVDCNDAVAAIHPGAAEICNGIDDDCNPLTLDGSGETAPLNDNQAGVCADSYKTCGGVLGWQNSYAAIPSYQAAETSCNDGLDNDCDGEWDYDTMDRGAAGNIPPKGDSSCQVGVTSISVSSATPVAGSSINVNCVSTVANVNSISASIDGVGLCTWQSWSGSTAIFSCNVGSTTGTKTVRCSVDPSKSYQSGTDKTTTINVLPTTCSAYTTSPSCDGDSRCDWCNQCAGVKYTGGSNRCVNAGTCPSPYCWQGQCGAACDPTQGGCTAGYNCDTTTCSCVCTPTAEICDDKDNNCDGQTDETFTNKGQSCTAGVGACQGTGTYICKADGTGTECNAVAGTPQLEICGNGIDEDCNGVDMLCTCTSPSWINTGNLAGAGVVFSLLQASDGTIYAGTAPNGYVFKSINEGTTWTNTGNLAGASEVYSLLQTTDGAIYAGTYINGDVFKSTDNGATWSNTGNLAGVGYVSSLIQTTDGAIYAGADKGGVFKSTDNGATWSNTGNLAGVGYVSSLIQTTDGAIYAGTYTNGDVFKSTDNGATWSNTGNLAGAHDVFSLLQTTDGAIYAGANGGNLYKSTDNGATWTGNIGGVGVTFSLLKASDGTIYAGTAPNGDVFKSSCSCIPQPELCDGLDNNCNGIIDEGCISLSPLIYYVEYMGETPAGADPHWEKITVIAATSSLTGIYDYPWDITGIPDQAIDIKITPFDGFFNATPVIVHVILDRTGDIKGKVQCCDKQGLNCVKVPFAAVKAGDYSSIADANGDYWLKDVFMGTYRVVASNIGNESQRIEPVVVEAQKETLAVDFNKVCPITIDCNPDCTVKGTEAQAYTTCDPRCNGVNGCVLDPHCEYAAKGSKVQYEEEVAGVMKNFEVTCCSGPVTEITTTEEKSKLEVDAKNIAKTTRVVYYKGKPVRMVVVTWD